MGWICGLCIATLLSLLLYVLKYGAEQQPRSQYYRDYVRWARQMLDILSEEHELDPGLTELARRYVDCFHEIAERPPHASD